MRSRSNSRPATATPSTRNSKLVIRTSGHRGRVRRELARLRHLVDARRRDVRRAAAVVGFEARVAEVLGRLAAAAARAAVRDDRAVLR